MVYLQMKFEKIFLDKLERCYAASSTIIDGKTKILLASEGHDACFMYSYPELKQTLVWDKPGGTMSMVQIPGGKGDFLAVQNFFPTFQSENATIVWARPINDDQWEIKTVLKLPFVHRFDILPVGDVNYFIGATLCTSKKDKEDWSDPGKIYVGILPRDLNEPIELKVIKDGLTKNHGYCQVQWNGKAASLITCEEGVFALTPPDGINGEWKVELVLQTPVSDVALVDIDHDGIDELITIEPFHGSNFVIRKLINGEYREVYKYPKEMDFGHVVWGGKLRGKATIIGGYRRIDKALFYIQCESQNPLKFKTGVIEAGTGPSNIAVINDKDKDMIISANREIGEAAIYYVTD